MIRWLIRAGLVFIIAAVVIVWGILVAASVLLVLGTASMVRRGRSKMFRAVLISVWCIALVLTTSVAVVAAGPRTVTRRKMIFRLYEVNCGVPFKTYRYPRDLVWLAEEDSHYGGSWSPVLVCH